MAISFIPFIPVDNFFSFFVTWRFFVQDKAAGFPPSPGWSTGEFHDGMKHCIAFVRLEFSDLTSVSLWSLLPALATCGSLL